MAATSPIEIVGLTALSIRVTLQRETEAEGSLDADAPFVALILGYTPLRTWWSKSNPSEANRIRLVVDLLGWSAASRGCRIFISASDGGGWIHQIMAELLDPAFLPEVDLPGKLVAGDLVRFLEMPGCLGPTLGLTCFAQSDVVVRRKRIWGLKPQLLAGAVPEMAAVLARGRHGFVEGVWPPGLCVPQADPEWLERAEADYFRYWCNLR